MVIGQREAINAASNAVRRTRANISEETKPLGSFLFLGPTGVGKTDLAKALSQTLIYDEEAMIRFDMSEYMESHSVSKLIGSPPGYIGHDEVGRLTESLRRKPYSILLFDEVEKAHPDIFNVLLQLLDDGRITDSKGRVVNGKNALIIMTSNIGSTEILNMEKDTSKEKLKEKLTEKLQDFFRPEFLNRIDDIILFDALSENDLLQIVDIHLNELNKRLLKNGKNLVVSQVAKQFIAKKSYDPNFGARPLKRYIQKNVMDKLAMKILENSEQLEFKVNLNQNSLEVITKELDN